MKKMNFYTVPLAVLIVSSCSNCKNNEPCTNEINITNHSGRPKVVWLSLQYPDTTYLCDYVKTFIQMNQTVQEPFGLRGCWEEVLESKPLQIFVLDSIIYADSSCTAIQNSLQLYQRFLWSKTQLQEQGWSIEIND
jgi:hypothetical protein